ncbi:hypothetical protein PDJAM_G00195420 [Pangasius djambal]|uniref:Uncharacterized protein n=1 Tax=Pangasius djambal TaxID=1691987 RepID=A0ACC5Y6T2_9TELE|nr:hypothetical protein [Pangasius djambal]
MNKPEETVVKENPLRQHEEETFIGKEHQKPCFRLEITSLSPHSVTAVRGREYKRAKLAVLSGWEGYTLSPLSITVTLAYCSASSEFNPAPGSLCGVSLYLS